tara:strand:- start:322 stop:909 length:588 start_codon:yes stop_codon:yes gene_type:complete
MANERLRPFRDYDEHEVINLFAFGDDAQALGTTDVVYAGSCVKVKTGWQNDQEVAELGNVGASYNNVVSQRYGVTAEVEYTDGGADEAALGIMLNDVREYDENGEALKFNPRKADELQACLTGQAVPIATRGLFLMATGAFTSSNNIAINMDIFATGDGKITTQGTKAVNNRIGRTLGGPDSDGSVLIKFDFTQG